MSRTFPFYRFAGSHREVGQQYGEACRDLIVQHRDLALERLYAHSHLTYDDVVERTLWYRPWLHAVAPFFIEELVGLAQGANITEAEAWLLQLRAEVAIVEENEAGDECTSYAIEPSATSDGVGLVGQNADLPAFYRDIAIVAELGFDDIPSILMVLPAGQLSYLGINDAGMGVSANFLTCDGWRVGVPRYFFSRLALTQRTVEDAATLIDSLHRASSRNLIMMDAKGTALDLETTVTESARLYASDGVLAHANNYLAPELLHAERSTGIGLTNSQGRFESMRSMLVERRGCLNVEVMMEVLCDHTDPMACVNRHRDDIPELDSMTFASLIMQPTLGKMDVAVGPPDENDFMTYAFGR
ncbi:MAG: C45 family autoproteolytic acyltransferase/hydrolase [Thermomicrobiales bacterium]|nr:C45 family autoproteolytic acyltransferase/hydrolase [Thermomicrobiales bacterium]